MQPIQAMARLEYTARILSIALKTPASMITRPSPTWRNSQTTRPGWRCSSREKKFDQDSEPE